MPKESKSNKKETKDRQRIIPFVLIGLGVVCLLAAGIFILDGLTSAEPAGLGKWIFDILVLALGAGASIQGWKGLVKKDNSSSGTKIVAIDEAQVATGEHGRNIKQGDNSKYFEHVGVYQEAPAPETHPALGSIPPSSADTYVHRGRIEEEVRDALRKGGASAIVGVHAPGGTGKTELAKQIAMEVHEGKFDFEDILWVDVNEKTPSEVLNEALRKCGIQLQPNAADTDKKSELHHFLLSRKLLVILDDVREHAAQGLRDILPPAPYAALITSRIQQMAGVRDFPLDRMDPAQARELFVNILGEDAVGADEETAAKLAERCKYNPLALEIAARRIRQNKGITNPIAKYFEKAEKRFDELKMHGDPRWNMTAVFDLSYYDLTEADRKYFRALAVFAPSGFAPQAAAHVWEMDESGAVLSRFINLSLVIPVEGDHERYRLHDLLDEYAMPKLQEAGEEEGVGVSLANWLIELFGEHYTDDFSNAPEVALEFENLSRMAEWAMSSQKGDLLALLATKPRNWLYNYFRQMDDWLYWLQTALKIGIEDKQLKANVLKAIGDVQQFRDDRDAALESYNQALTLYRQVGAKMGEANVLKAIGDVQQFRDDRDAALESYNQALTLYRQVGAKMGEANVLQALIRFELVVKRDIDNADRKLHEIIKMRHAIGDIFSEGADYFNFSVTLTTMNLWEDAIKYCLMARGVLQKIGEENPVLQTIRLERGIIILNQQENCLCLQCLMIFLKNANKHKRPPSASLLPEVFSTSHALLITFHFPPASCFFPFSSPIP